MDDAEIERRLITAQARVREVDEARVERQAAVMAARGHGWTVYKIAQVLGVTRPTVDSIITAAEKAQKRSQ